MPSTPNDVFGSAGIEAEGKVRWGQPVPENACGVYIVAITEDPDICRAPYREVPLSIPTLRAWLGRFPSFTLDGMRPSVEQLAKRLGSFWLPDETIVYVGKTGSALRRRVNQYYETPLGDRRWHSGGAWVKTLSILNGLTVFWSRTSDHKEVEGKMLTHFGDGVSSDSRAAYPDPLHVLPFANIIDAKGRRKEHGIEGALAKE